PTRCVRRDRLPASRLGTSLSSPEAKLLAAMYQPQGKLSKGIAYVGTAALGRPRRAQLARLFAQSRAIGSSALLRFRDVRTVLKVVLQNLRGQGGAHTLSLRFDRTHHFSAADDFGGRE